MGALLKDNSCVPVADARRPGLAEEPVHLLPAIGSEDYNAILDKFSGRHVAHAPEVNQIPGQVLDEQLVSIIERQCRQSPSAMAVFDSKRSLTYFDLLQRGREIATCLLTTPGLRNPNLTAGHPELVGLGMERGCEWVIAMVGVLLAGMAYVPLDPSHPKNRLENLIEQTELKTVLSTATSYSQFRWIEEGHHAKVLIVEDLKGGPVDLKAIEKAKPHPSDVSFVLFTSGSTGEPKGVMVTHQGVLNLVHAFRPLLSVPPPDVRSQVAPMTFDLHAMDVYCAFDVGAVVAICSKEELLTDLNAFLKRTRVTGIVCTPTVASLLDPAKCPDLKWLALGGEMLPRVMVSKWIAAGRTVMDHFGPTETSIAATVQVWKPGDEVQDHIGRPLPGSHIYILGPELEVLPVGVAGEVCVAGCHVSAGYLKRPDLTARAYRENPFSLGRHDRRLYRTGDRGRWLPTGNIQLLGRIDFQVKIRGNRVEPEEIEDKMGRVPGVQRCVVVKKSDEKVGDFLAAFLVLDRPDADETSLRIRIRDTVAAACPSYMVPAAYVIMDALPLTRSGKVDRKQLPQPDRGSFLSFQEGAQEGQEEQGSCKTEAEVMTAGVFGSLLGIQDVTSLSPASNFFQLGGNSFLAAQALAHLLEAFGLLPLSVTIRNFFEDPTVGALAARLEEKQKAMYLQPDTSQQKLVANHMNKPNNLSPRLNRRKQTAVEGRRVEGGGGGRHRLVQQTVPLSQAQEVMWIVLHVLPNPEVVDMTDVWTLKGPLHPPRLQTALQQLLVRHQALRLRFSSDRTAVGGKFMSMVLDRWNAKGGSGEVSAGYARLAGAVTGMFGPLFVRNMHRIVPKVVTQIDQDPTIVPITLNVVDLSGETERDRRWKLENALASARRPLDMKASSGLLFRVTLITVRPEDHLLVFMYSHLIFDGISAAAFYCELQHAYATGGIDDLPPVASYSDYVAWEAEWLASGVEQREKAYWSQLLGRDPEQLKLASKLPAKTFVAIPCRGAWIELALEASLKVGLERVAHSMGATLNMALLAAFHLLLHVYSQQRRIIVGILVGRRPLGQHQGMMGHVADIMPILSDFQPGKTRPSPKTSLQTVTDTSKEATMALSFRDVVLQIKERVLECLENQSITFRIIISEVLSQPDFAKATLLQAYFNFLQPGTNASPHSFKLGEAEASFDLKRSWAREGEVALTPVNLLLRQMEDGSIQGRLVYQADVFDSHIMEAMSKQFKILVEQACHSSGL